MAFRHKRLAVNFFLLLGVASNVGSEGPSDSAIVDAHAHFFQMPASQLIKAMDEHNVNVAVVMPVPNAGTIRGRNSNRNRTATDDFYLAAAKTFPRKIAAFYGGSTLNQILLTTQANALSNKDRESFRNHVIENLKEGYRGIGELGPRHIAWRPGMHEIRFPADHPLMRDIADVAAQYDIPLDIHLEATGDSVPQFERLLAHNPKTRIIWAHAGWSNTGLATPELIKMLMSRYSNLYSSIKYRRTTGQNPGLFDNRGTLNPNWKSLFEEFPERFVVGTDVKLGDEDTDYRIMDSHRAILRQLSNDAAKKIGWENAVKILHLNEFSK